MRRRRELQEIGETREVRVKIEPEQGCVSERREGSSCRSSFNVSCNGLVTLPSPESTLYGRALPEKSTSSFLPLTLRCFHAGGHPCQEVYFMLYNVSHLTGIGLELW